MAAMSFVGKGLGESRKMVTALTVIGLPALRWLAKRFDLTARETLVLRTLFEVGGVPLTAEFLGISPTTARSHVTAIFDKTGVRSQPGLIRLMMDMAPPFGGPQ